VLVLFAACVGLSLLSLHLVQQMRAGQTTIAELQAQVAKLESRPPAPAPQVFTVAPIVEPEPIASAPASPSKDVVTALSMKRAAPANPEGMFANGPSREDRARMFREARERQRQLMQDPEYREALRIQQRSNMNRQYPGLAQELGITTEQTEQLFDLLVEQQMRNSEQNDSMWDPGEGMDQATMQQRREKMQQQWQEMQRKNEAELAAQLGSDKMQAWKDYQSTLGARHQAEQLRSTLSGRGVPLSEDASRAVVKAYAEAQKAEMQEYANMGRANAGANVKSSMVGWAGASPQMYERQMELAKKRNQRVLDALSPYLSYEQREAVQKEQEAELKMQEAQMRMMRAQSTIDRANGNNGGWASDSVQAVILPAQ